MSFPDCITTDPLINQKRKNIYSHFFFHDLNFELFYLQVEKELFFQESSSCIYVCRTQPPSRSPVTWFLYQSRLLALLSGLRSSVGWLLVSLPALLCFHKQKSDSDCAWRPAESPRMIPSRLKLIRPWARFRKNFCSKFL